MLRRRFRFAFAFCALAVLAIVAATLWRFGLLAGTAGPGDDRLIAAVLLFAAVGGAFFYIWVSVEYRLLKPLDTLQGEVEAALHAPTHGPMDVTADTMVEPLGRAVERLVRLRERERNEFDGALAAATEKLDGERRHLETVLRPLREGVVMCDAAQIVVLHNDAAYARLSRNAEFGLGRSIFEALARDGVEAAMARLDGDTDTVDTEVALTGDDAVLAVRIARIRDDAGEVFVYSFDPARSAA